MVARQGKREGSFVCFLRDQKEIIQAFGIKKNPFGLFIDQ